LKGSIMKTHLAALLVSLAVAGSANAAISVSLANGDDGTFNNNPLAALTGFSQAIYNGTVGGIEFAAGADTAGVVAGNLAGTYAAPHSNPTRYIYGLREGTTVYFGSKASPVATTSFLIHWGSIDALVPGGYDNVLTLSNGNSITGTDLVALGLAVGDGSQANPLNNRWFLISDDRPFTSFTAFSSSNAFEFDMAVPEPATWAMMILGFGLVGFAARRRERLALAAA